MRTIKIYFKRAPFYNALIVHVSRRLLPEKRKSLLAASSPREPTLINKIRGNKVEAVFHLPRSQALAQRPASGSCADGSSCSVLHEARRSKRVVLKRRASVPKEFYGSKSSMEKRISISRAALWAANVGPQRSQIGRGPSSESAGGFHRGLESSAQCRRR